MGRSTMNFLILALLATEISSAATKADSILAFTGNRHIRAVWVRDAWCDANYNPIASHAGMRKTQLMVYSTSETSGPRELNPEDVLSWAPCITRKDGSHVVWADVVNKCAWIRDFNCTSARRNLNLGTDFDVLSVDYNKATGAENMYIMTFGRGQRNMILIETVDV